MLLFADTCDIKVFLYYIIRIVRKHPLLFFIFLAENKSPLPFLQYYPWSTAIPIDPSCASIIGLNTSIASRRFYYYNHFRHQARKSLLPLSPMSLPTQHMEIQYIRTVLSLLRQC